MTPHPAERAGWQPPPRAAAHRHTTMGRRCVPWQKISAENRWLDSSPTGVLPLLISIFHSGYFSQCGKPTSISVNSQLADTRRNDFPHLCTKAISQSGGPHHRRRAFWLRMRTGYLICAISRPWTGTCCGVAADSAVWRTTEGMSRSKETVKSDCGTATRSCPSRRIAAFVLHHATFLSSSTCLHARCGTAISEP